MRFTDGYWKVREDCSLYQAGSAGEMEIRDDSVTIYASGVQNGGRKNLGGITLTVTFFSPAKDCIAVRAAHHFGGGQQVPAFYESKGGYARVHATEEEVVIRSGSTEARIARAKEWKVEFFHNARKLTQSGWRSLGYAVQDSGERFMKEELQLSVGENIFGLGERFTPFIKNGQSVEIWNRDGGTSSEQSYKNIPFYVSDRDYGVLINDSGKVSLEVGSEKVERVQFSVPGESLEYCVIGAESIAGVLRKYARLTGLPALPPAWSFGLWLTTSFTTDYDEKTVTHFIDGMEERDIPLQVFHFDCFWMRGGHWCDFRWDREAFPDPEGMLQRLKGRGLKICVWINPYIAQRSVLFEEGMQKGYFIHNTDGTVWQTDEWQPGMAIVDFSNPDACAWYQEKLRTLLAMGVDTFKTDFGERIPEKDVVYANGMSPEKMHNYYAYLYNKTVFDLLEQDKGKGEALVFARSATCGGQRFPVHWGGDCVASYESMAESLRGGLSLAMCGFGFWSHDMGGFENKATPDLYKRWTAFGMFSTHSRLHGNSSYRVPWLFDEEAVDVLRFFTKTKCALMPYLFGSAVRTSQTGIPMMKPMIVDFENDPVAPFLDRQYMLGESLLVAPVFSEQGEVTYYLPEGKWTNYFTGECQGQGWRKEKWDYFGLPVMVRENTILPVGKAAENALVQPKLPCLTAADAQAVTKRHGHTNSRTVYEYEKHITLEIYELLSEAKVCIYRNDGTEAGMVRARRERDEISISVEGIRDYEILFVNVRQAEDGCNVQGMSVERGYLVRPIDPEKEGRMKVNENRKKEADRNGCD